MNSVEKEVVLHCLKSMIDEEVCEECPLYGTTGTDHCEKDCVRLAINALEQEPCDDCVSRQAVLDALDKSKYSNEFCEEHHIDWSINLGMAHIVVNELKPVTPQQKMGYWERDKFTNQPTCLVCGYKVFGGQTNYCPNCGAKMSENQTGAEGSEE